MNSESIKYYEKRKAQQMYEYMEDAEDLAKDIAKIYRKSSAYLNNESKKLFKKFKLKHKLSEKEAYRLLNKVSEKDIFSNDDLWKQIKKELTINGKSETLAELESHVFRSRIQKIQELQQDIDVMMRDVYNQEKDFTTRHYVSLSNEAYYRTIFDIQKDTGFSFSFNLLDKKKINNMLHASLYGQNYSSRIWNNTSALAKDLKEELIINMLTGRTEQEMSNIISNKFNTGAIKGRRLVRTESAYFLNEFEAQAYEECDIDKYIFLATLDLRTSEMCRRLDLKVFLTKKRKNGVNHPPMHPWCRSTTIAYLGKNTLKKLERRARDPITGKTYKVPANTNYQQWYNENVAKNQMQYLKKEHLDTKHRIKNNINVILMF